VLAARHALTLAQRRAAADAITAAVLDSEPVRTLSSGAVVAAYVSMATEPATGELLRALTARGYDVVLPVLRPDRALDWSRLRAPGTVLDPDAIETASLVLVPALACAEDGTRLGRGGGSYDRSLARLPAGVPTCALLYDGELVPALPHDPHDVPVTAGCLPSAGWVTLTGTGAAR